MAQSTPNQYRIVLSPEQRERFLELTRNGHAPAKKIRHAQILLWSDVNRPEGGLTRTKIAAQLTMHVNSVDRVRKRFVLEGEEPALNRQQRARPAIEPKIDGHGEALLIAICTGPAPEGRTRWTLRLLADELKKRGLVTQVCAETVRQALKKTLCNPGASNVGAYPSAIMPGSSRKWKASSTCMPQSIARKSR